MTRNDRQALVEFPSELPLKTQTELLGLNRSSLYYKPVEIPEAELDLKHRIDRIYTQWPFYGSRRISVMLRREGLIVNRKAEQRHMRENGIAGICPGPNPYLLRGLSIQHPNHVWGIDITYIRMQKSFTRSHH